MYYKLDGKNVVAEGNMREWALSSQNKEARRVAQDTFGDITISTVFLGVDLGLIGGQPVVFETMVFGGSLDGEFDRYCTYEQAEQGHLEMVQRVLKEEDISPSDFELRG